MAAATTAGDAGDGRFAVVTIPPSAQSPEAVIRFLTGELVATGRLPATDAEAVIDRLLRREQLGSTGIGRGLAIPHATAPAVEQTTFLVGRATHPLDWVSLDGEPVGVVCLILTPATGHRSHLRDLEALVHRLRDDFRSG